MMIVGKKGDVVKTWLHSGHFGEKGKNGEKKKGKKRKKGGRKNRLG